MWRNAIGARSLTAFVIALSIVAGCQDGKETSQLRQEVGVLKKDAAAASARIAALEKELGEARKQQAAGNEKLTTIAPVQRAEPSAEPAELAAANDLLRANGAILGYCQETSLFDKVAEAKCVGEQLAGLEKLIRGRPLGVGVSAAAFGIVRVKCAKAFPRDLEMRAFCEEQELQKVAP